MSVGFRPMRDGQEDAVAAMVRQLPKDLGLPVAPKLTGEALRKAKGLVHVTVAEDSGLLLGACLWLFTFSTWRGCKGMYVVDLFVMEHARGKKVGERLLQSAGREAAAAGALGTVVLAALYGKLSWAVLVGSTLRTVRITAMILFIVTCGSVFAAVFVAAGGMQTVTDILQAKGVGPGPLIAMIIAVIFVAGFMLDPLVIILIVVPVTAPLVAAAGYDIVWYCVLFLVVLQTAYLTPPMAPSIFYLRGIAPPEITLHDMYRGVWPFIGIQLAVIVLLIVFPDLVLWLPAKMQSF